LRRQHIDLPQTQLRRDCSIHVNIEEQPNSHVCRN
jgi:hypothetical protein